jgi:hypothetical protein
MRFAPNFGASFGIYLKGNSGQGDIMGQVIELPLWQFVLILLFAAVTFASHFLFPSVRWFFRRRLERAVAQLNTRLERPISPFKLARRHDMIQRLSYDPQVARAIAEHALESGEREDVAFQRARKYAREIVPGFSATAYFSFGTRLSKWLARSFYNVEVRSVRRRSNLCNESPLEHGLPSGDLSRGQAIGACLCGRRMGASLAAQLADPLNGGVFYPPQSA